MLKGENDDLSMSMHGMACGPVCGCVERQGQQSIPYSFSSNKEQTRKF